MVTGFARRPGDRVRVRDDLSIDEVCCMYNIIGETRVEEDHLYRSGESLIISECRSNRDGTDHWYWCERDGMPWTDEMFVDDEGFESENNSDASCVEIDSNQLMKLLEE